VRRIFLASLWEWREGQRLDLRSWGWCELAWVKFVSEYSQRSFLPSLLKSCHFLLLSGPRDQLYPTLDCPSNHMLLAGRACITPVPPLCYQYPQGNGSSSASAMLGPPAMIKMKPKASKEA